MVNFVTGFLRVPKDLTDLEKSVGAGRRKVPRNVKYKWFCRFRVIREALGGMKMSSMSYIVLFMECQEPYLPPPRNAYFERDS